MCGIVGYVGPKNAINVLMDGLKTLEYRGYDSAGIAYRTAGRVEIIKANGKIKNLKNKLILLVCSFECILRIFLLDGIHKL